LRASCSGDMKTRMFLPLVVVLSVAAALPTGCRSTHGWRTLSQEPLDGQGLHEVFLKARAIMEQPYIPAGEDSEWVDFQLRDQWIFVGDKRFAEALAKEKPDVIAPSATSSQNRGWDEGQKS
ncbi:MAG: hypothetical protein ACKO39_13760, partial [Chthoniobacterales bacterium]